MDLKALSMLATQVKDGYRSKGALEGEKAWSASQYVLALAGDFGDLSKLILKKEGFRISEAIDEKIAHELADCLWCLLVLADALSIDLETAYLQTMAELNERISSNN